MRVERREFRLITIDFGRFDLQSHVDHFNKSVNQKLNSKFVFVERNEAISSFLFQPQMHTCFRRDFQSADIPFVPSHEISFQLFSKRWLLSIKTIAKTVMLQWVQPLGWLSFSLVLKMGWNVRTPIAITSLLLMTSSDSVMEAIDHVNEKRDKGIKVFSFISHEWSSNASLCGSLSFLTAREESEHTNVIMKYECVSVGRSYSSNKSNFFSSFGCDHRRKAV